MKNKYGCIGRKLSHSFSREIHRALADYEYNLIELEPNELSDFLNKREFKGVNVTVPYKEASIQYLDEIDSSAEEIGAVNTIFKDACGRLIGYNTDFYGLKSLILHVGVDIQGKKVAILGTGGTSKTARAVVRHLGAREILTVSRTPSEGEISYEQLYASHFDCDVIINTTPVGMYPDVYKTAVDISPFNNLYGVVDVVYNPLRTTLVSAAIRRGIPASSGLYMLVAQAVKASEIFIEKSYPKEVVDEVYSKILKEKETIVLIGMPSSGKSTVGKLLAEALSRPFIDTDELVEARAGMKISEIFEKYGEKHFRMLEKEAVMDAAKTPSAVIATGGGAVLSSDNVAALKQNGRLYFIDRPLETLIPTSDRPTASDRAKIKALYEARFEIYMDACDERITDTETALSVMNQIRRYYL